MSTAARELILKGVAASPGIALARALRLDSSEPEVEERTVAPEAVAAEVERFKLPKD